jgi:hypothetical protein
MIAHRTVRETPLGSLQPAERSMAVPFADTASAKLNALAVEFIAKPGKTDELRELLCQVVTPLLRDRTGFIRSIFLTAREEPRRVVVITLWSTEDRSVGDPLEESPLVRELLSSLIDARSKTRTYRIDLAEGTEAYSQVITLPIC